MDLTEGSRLSKAELLDSVRRQTLPITTMSFPVLAVKVSGSVAIAQGTNTATLLRQGKELHGAWAWMDVFEKRGGRWYWLASENSMVGDKITDRFVCAPQLCPLQPGFTLTRKAPPTAQP
jgi:hypothetical protein